VIAAGIRQNRDMLIAGLVLAAAAAAFHVFIFALESLKWTEPSTRKVFGVASEADAVTMKQLAFNQGFYNLFLALTTLLGIVFVLAGAGTVGVTLVFAGTGMMLAAALVLVLSDRTKTRAAAMQGTLPLLAVVVTALGVALAA
jgi:putative membrane protein